MIKIALLGFGNVGRAFTRYLTRPGEADARHFKIFGVADITGGLLLQDTEDALWLLEQQEHGRTIAECASRGTFLDVPAYVSSLPHAGISVLVECLPTNPADGQPALRLLLMALDNRLRVVTVDKGPVVHGFEALLATCRMRDTRIVYSGTTGVRPPSEISGCHVLEIHGVLNGTTNYILTEMQVRELSFEQAVTQAREKGIAEPNPDLDIQGWDTACKILILANEWMAASATLGDVLRVGIGPETEEMIRAARQTGGAVRLIGRARLSDGRAHLSVAPNIVGPESLLHSVSGTSKGAVFRTRQKGEIFASGLSGRDAIAKTILEDIKTVTQI